MDPFQTLTAIDNWNVNTKQTWWRESQKQKLTISFENYSKNFQFTGIAYAPWRTQNCTALILNQMTDEWRHNFILRKILIGKVHHITFTQSSEIEIKWDSNQDIDKAYSIKWKKEYQNQHYRLLKRIHLTWKYWWISFGKLHMVVINVYWISCARFLNNEFRIN